MQKVRQKQKVLEFFFQKSSDSKSRFNSLKSANEKKSDGLHENFVRNCTGEKDGT